MSNTSAQSITYVGPSAIIGDGLFAAVKIPADTVIIEYIGDEVDPLTTTVDHDNVYVTPDGRCINGTNDARYINDIVDLRKLSYAETAAFFTKKEIPLKSGYAYNCRFLDHNGHVLVVSNTDIEPNTELFIEYGFNYWFSEFIRKSLIDYSYQVRTWSSRT